MSKLIIQIPCYDEAQTLAIALSSLPRRVEGFDTVEWLIVNDGSKDDTVKIAKRCGVDHIVSHTQNQGLARAFMTGINACLALGADVIVNTDADNQYEAADIPALVRPILDGTAEIVIGARPIVEIEHFSSVKKFLQRLGSTVVRLASETDIPDAPSGFRAMSRAAAAQLVVYNRYTYTLETIIQAGQSGIPITSVPVRVNEDLRPSRLVKSIFSYITRNILTIFRIFVLYRPFLFFMTIGSLLFLLGLGISIRFLGFYFSGDGDGHVQSLILGAMLLSGGAGTWLMAIISSLLASNRRLLEEIRFTQNINSKKIVPHLWSREGKGCGKETVGK